MTRSFAEQSTSLTRPAPLAAGLAFFLLGITGDLLLAEVDPGLSLALWIGALCWTWWRLRRSQEHPILAQERALLLVAVALGAGWVWRENETLRLLDAAGMVVVFALLALAARPLPVALTPVSLVQAGVALGWRMVAGWLPAMVEAGRAPGQGRARHGGAVARGTLIAVPSLLLFGALLGQADPAFGHFLAGLVRVDLEVFLQHALTVLGLAWVAAAVLLGTRARELPAVPEILGPARGLGSIEVVMTLGSLDLLFLAFIGFQLPYFFGGTSFVMGTAGVTLAEYARRGFFELCAVAGLMLPLLLFFEAVVPRAAGLARRWFRVLAGTAAALLLAIMGSALHRMLIYQAEFGLTEDRLFATALIGGLAVTTCWFVATALQGGAARFMRGALVGWIAWLAMLHAVNPEQVIVRANVARAEAGHPLDKVHLAGLGNDAVPSLVAALPRIPAAERVWLRRQLAGRFDPTDRDIRGWTLARARANRSLQQLVASPPER